VARRSHLGNPAELAVAAELTALGYLVGSRRHIAGPGDLLAVGTLPGLRVWGSSLELPRPPTSTKSGQALLVEVKATTTVPWASSNFSPEDRLAMTTAAAIWDVEPILAWRPPGVGATIWLPPEDWPAASSAR
jgi:hypothetical protein